MNTAPRILIAAALLAALSACGNKGPLVQAPSPDTQEEQVPPADADVPAAETEPATEPATTEPATTEPATGVPVEEDQPVPADPVPPPPPAEDDGTP